MSHVRSIVSDLIVCKRPCTAATGSDRLPCKKEARILRCGELSSDSPTRSQLATESSDLLGGDETFLCDALRLSPGFPSTAAGFGCPVRWDHVTANS